MIQRFSFGTLVETDAVVQQIQAQDGLPPFGTVTGTEPLSWTYGMSPDDIVWGLGENLRGMNKRGGKYISWCTDESHQTESAQSLYGAHNFIIVSGKKTFGVFFDTPSRVAFDIGWTATDTLTVTGSAAGVDMYIITADSTTGGKSSKSEAADVAHQFRMLIGTSYIPPRWGFGFQQSRWGYRTEADIADVISQYRKASLPLDAVCMDIDYMKDYEDFTVDEGKFPGLARFASDAKAQGVHLIPIIDAGVKAKEGYSVYDEGTARGYFCTEEDGKPFTAGVWPGRSRFPDFLRPDVRAWFGAQYRKLTSLGIEGFWNDMNEPAMFYSDESLAEAFKTVRSFEGRDLDIDSFFAFTAAGNTFNRMDDYERFYHTVTMKDGTTERLRHDTVHNMFGASMTRAAGEGLAQISPDRRMLLYSRASCIGAHRYGGIWTGDNSSWWTHLKQEIHMMAGLNMCGFLYTGADIGGFGADTTPDLLLRWMEFGVFTPLMRNHAALHSRPQECYRFGNDDAFRSVLELRYSLIPFLYSEFVKAALSDGMYFRPLGFDYPADMRAARTEDELLLGESLLVAPVYEQNAEGRYVYLPEDMIQVTWRHGMAQTCNVSKGDTYVNVPSDAVVFFIRHGHLVPLCRPAQSSDRLDTSSFTFLGDGDSYGLYEDDGYTRGMDLGKYTRTLMPRK